MGHFHNGGTVEEEAEKRLRPLMENFVKGHRFALNYVNHGELPVAD